MSLFVIIIIALLYIQKLDHFNFKNTVLERNSLNLLLLFVLCKQNHLPENNLTAQCTLYNSVLLYFISMEKLGFAKLRKISQINAAV